MKPRPLSTLKTNLTENYRLHPAIAFAPPYPNK